MTRDWWIFYNDELLGYHRDLVADLSEAHEDPLEDGPGADGGAAEWYPSASTHRMSSAKAAGAAGSRIM